MRLALLLPLVLVPGSDWPQFRGDPGLSGVAAGTLPADLGLLWTFQAGGAITSSPAVVDGRVYFGSDDRKLHCLEAATGKELWAFETQDIIEAPPLVIDGLVVFGSWDFFVYALDAKSGELRWKHETDDKIVGGANWVRTEEGLKIVVGSYDSKLYGFDATGTLLWTYETQNYVNGTPSIWNGDVVFGGCDTVLHRVSAVTGEARKTVPLGDSCNVAGSAALVDGRAYFGHYGNQFVCIDLDTGETVWAYDGRREFVSSPAVTADRVVFGGGDKRLHCVARADGKPLWSFATRRKVDGSPVVVGDAVVFGSADGRLYVLDLDDGEERWSHDLGEGIGSSPAVVDGRIFVGVSDGKFHAFGPGIAAEEGQDG